MLEIIAYFIFAISTAGHAEGTSAEKVDPIIVTGSRPEESTPEELPRREYRLDESGISTVADAIRKDPSVYLREIGGKPGTASLSIRGQDPSQTRLYLEGIPLTDSAYQKSPLELLSADFFSQVDLYPSAAPIRFLDDGFGGAINVKRGEVGPAWRAQAKGGSFGYVKGSVEAPIASSHSLLVEASRSNEDFAYFQNNGTLYQTNDDSTQTRKNNGFWRVTVLPWAEWALSARSRQKTFALVSLGDSELPGTIQQPQAATLHQTYALLGAVDERRIFSKSEMKNAVYARYQRETFTGFLPASLWVPAATTSMAVGAKSTASLGAWSLGLGGHWESFSPESINSKPLQQRLQLPVGISYRIALGDSLSVTPAVLGNAYFYSAENDARFSTATTSQPDPQKEMYLLSPRIGIEWQTKIWNRKVRSQVGVGHYHRPPSLIELYGSSWGITPNTSLKEESAWKAEWETVLQIVPQTNFFETVEMNYSFYASRSENLISLLTNSPQTRRAQNIGSGTIIGNEMGLLAKTNSGLYTRGWISLVRSRNLTNTFAQYQKELPARPNRYRAEMGFDNQTFRAFYALEGIGANYLDLANSTSVEASWEHSLGVAYRSKKWGQLSLDLKNIFNQTTVPGQIGQSSVTELASQLSGYPAPGRRVYVTWRHEL